MQVDPVYKKQVLKYVERRKYDSYSARLVGKATQRYEKTARLALLELEKDGDLMLVKTEPHERWIASTQTPLTDQEAISEI